MRLDIRGISAFALGVALATGAAAQDGGATDALRDRILVEGTKKAEGEAVQDVPIAVTAYGADQLDALFFKDLSSLSYVVPNVQFEDIGTSPGTANFVMRGVGVNSSIPSIDPAVATVVDGVPLAINYGVVFDNFDVAAVEVMRGPQGTLFGRNSTAGAVVVRTTDPTEDWEATGKISLESGLRFTASGRVSGPILEDVLQGKLAVYMSADEGYWDNEIDANAFVGLPASSEDSIGGRDTVILRTGLRFTPSDVLEVVTKGEFASIVGSPNAAQNRGLNGDTFTTSIDELGTFDAEWFNLSHEVNLTIGEGVLTGVLGYRDFESTTFGDIDSGPLFVFHAYNNTAHDQFTGELRYATRVLDRADLTVGAFYLSDTLNYIEDREIPSSTLPFLGGGVQDRTSLGLFAQADVDVTDQLVVTLGGRFNDEEKEVGIVRTFASTGCTRDGCTSFDFEETASFDNFSPKFGAQYRVSEDVQIYASYTEAVRAGGYNFRNTSPVAPFTGTDDEEVVAIEFGGKGDFLDGRLRVNAAAFTYDFTDMQREVNESDPIVGVVQQIVNTADATIQGFEVEFQAFPLDNLIITGHVGIVDGEYDEVLFDISGDGVVDEKDLALDIPRLAPQTYGLGVIYDQDLGSAGILTARANINHRSSAAYTDSNLGTLPAADIVDASLGYSPLDGGWTLSLYGKNLLDEVTFGNDTQLPANFPGSTTFAVPGLDGSGATFSPLNKGRIFGVEAQFNY